MIVYFADRKMNILGQASTQLPKGLTITEDLKTEDIETGVAVFECKIPYDAKTRENANRCAEVGNYILRSNNNENEFYTIIDTEIDTKNQEIYVYAEDAGLDLLNEVYGAYEADKAYPITHYINMFSYDSGFVIGVNEAAGLTRKLSWDSEATGTERIASVATQFDNCEVSYSFDIKGLEITKKYINIYKKRGKDIGAQLRLNQDIDNIITKKSIANLATALVCTGGTPENEENPITLNGYQYDDGNFYVDGTYLKSREALKKWSRYIWANEPGQVSDVGHIVKTYSYDTTSKSELCNRALTELKKVSEIEVNYEVELSKLPDNVRIGDRVNIIDNTGELYLSTRILKLEISIADQTQKATLGEYLIKGSGISQKVYDLAEQFSKNSISAARALMIANNAKTIADAAQSQASQAVSDAENAQEVADAAQQLANNATQSAEAAQTAANNAQTAVDLVKEDVAGLEKTVTNAQAAAEQAKQAAETADTKAEEAHTAAINAATSANEAKEAAQAAEIKAESAEGKSDTAQSKAEQAMQEAEAAATTAEAAQADAEMAQGEIDALGESLTTLSNTMQADYARKTELTEAKASLQTQITQNADTISTHASQISIIDETVNNAAAQAAQAQTTASAAQTQANEAKAEAEAAQTAADSATAAAQAAQSEANTAKTAAETAQTVADQAQANLEDAKADLETVTSRVDATEEEILAAQKAVEQAQQAADAAKEDALSAAQTAAAAQNTADTAAANASAAQTAANEAASDAALAQQLADQAKGDAAAAQAKADEAAETAADAQLTALQATQTATEAQTAANAAAQTASVAQAAADAADKKAEQAKVDLITAQENLEAVTSRVDATEEEVAAAQSAVEAAQAAVSAAQEEAAAAQAAADIAQSNAEEAQADAAAAKQAADTALADAAAAQAAADAAKENVDALAVRVTKAETNITQNSEAIALAATKEEVSKTLGGYYTKEETDSAISVKANEITQTVNETYTTKQELDDTSAEIHETITEQNTALTQTCQEIILQALTSYTETGDFESFRETTEAQLSFLSNQLTIKFTETSERLESMNSSLQEQLNTITKYFTFDVNGITIGQVDNPNKVIIDNDRYSMAVNGSDVMWIENGKVYTPEIEVSKGFKLFGYLIDQDQVGNVNLEYMGGDQ